MSCRTFPFALITKPICSLLMLLVLIVLLSACGKKGKPKPPEEFAPSAVLYFEVKGEVNAVLLSWEAPESMANGDLLEDLDYFLVERSDYEQGEAPDYEDLQEVPLREAEAAAGQSQEAAAQEEAVQKYSYRDEDVAVGQTYFYRVLAVNEDGVSGESAGNLKVTFVGESSIIERR